MMHTRRGMLGVRIATLKRLVKCVCKDDMMNNGDICHWLRDENQCDIFTLRNG